jgi:uncharacterized membrane protein YhaH (DUF805 family)
LNSNTAAGLLGLDKSVYDILITGKQEDAPALNVDYGLVIGTRPLVLTDPLFEEVDTPRDGVVIKHDAVPKWWHEQGCDPNLLYVFASHDQLPGAWPVRDFIYRLANAKLHEDNPMQAVLGYGQSLQVTYQGCADGDTVVFVGDRISDQQTAHACSCGDGICALGENFINCPQDCATFWQRFNVCLWMPWIVNLLLVILFVSSIIYVYRKEKTHDRGKGFGVMAGILAIVIALAAAHYLTCQYLIPLAILLIILIVLILGGAWLHFKRAGPKQAKPKGPSGGFSVHRYWH